MKPFDLEKALAGEPVRLRNGQKAVILCRVPDEYVFEDESPAAFPLYGLIFTAENYIDNGDACWRDNGTYDSRLHKFDIIGMWEELIKFEDLPKPFIPRQSEEYFSVSPNYDRPEVLYANSLDHPSIKNGNCFRTEEDAQKWIDFMKSQIEE